LEGAGLKPGKPLQLISSTKAEYCPAYSPDGKRIAFVSEQSGAPDIWICESDGRNPVQLTSFAGPTVGGPKWSPEGQEIAFYAAPNGNRDIYVVSASRGAPRRLTTQPGIDQWPYWSQDGLWLYFCSERSGEAKIWKIPSQGGEAIQLTQTKELEDVPQESLDGKYIYYSRGWPYPLSVWKLPLESGEETKVLDSVHPLALWTLRQEGIYFFTAPDDKGSSELCFYEFASGKTRKNLKVERGLSGLAVSPDGRAILYSQLDDSGSDLMLVENFK
jgi:Tol biopolymer transport system component